MEPLAEGLGDCPGPRTEGAQERTSLGHHGIPRHTGDPGAQGTPTGARRTTVRALFTLYFCINILHPNISKIFQPPFLHNFN